MHVSIGKVATMIGVAVSTLRRQDNEGKLPADCKTIGKYRRYNSITIIQYMKNQTDELQSVNKNTFETAIVYMGQ